LVKTKSLDFEIQNNGCNEPKNKGSQNQSSQLKSNNNKSRTPFNINKILNPKPSTSLWNSIN
jgi:hypothetical protein